MKRFDKARMRQQAICSLVRRHAIESQDSLVMLLQAEHGIDADQSVVSRDIRELGIVKKTVRGVSMYELPDATPEQEILRHAVMRIDYNDSLVVVKTFAGLAAFVGDYLDVHAGDLGILATLAGENVLFVALKTGNNVADVAQRIALLLHYKEKDTF